MTAAAIRQKLYDYIRIAEDKKVKAIYTMLESEIEEKTNPWENKEFVAEMDKRTSELESGKVKGYSLEEVKHRARTSAKLKNK